jgi:hypothetical protein
MLQYLQPPFPCCSPVGMLLSGSLEVMHSRASLFWGCLAHLPVTSFLHPPRPPAPQDFNAHIAQAQIASFATPREGSAPPLRFLFHARTTGGGSHVLVQVRAGWWVVSRLSAGSVHVGSCRHWARILWIFCTDIIAEKCLGKHHSMTKRALLAARR